MKTTNKIQLAAAFLSAMTMATVLTNPAIAQITPSDAPTENEGENVNNRQNKKSYILTSTTESLSTPDNSQKSPNTVTPPPGAAANSDDVKQMKGLSPDIGEIKEVEGCSKSLFGGWGKGRQTDQCKWELPKALEDQGWIIFGANVDVKSRVGKNHRSGAGTSFTGSNSSFSYVSSTLDTLQRDINVALSKGDTKLAADLKLKHEAVRKSSLESSSSHNTAILDIWTQSGAATRAGIDAKLIVKLMKIR
jgi:hypothetical protein